MIFLTKWLSLINFLLEKQGSSACPYIKGLYSIKRIICRLCTIPLLAKTQRYKLAKYAGTEWKSLLAYLKGQDNALGGYDG